MAMHVRASATCRPLPARLLGLAVIAVFGCGLALPSGRAAEAETAVAKSEAHLILEMPGLTQGRETFQSFGWDARFNRKTFYAAQVAKSGAYPRAQVYYIETAPNRLWVSPTDLTETWLKGLVPFLADKTLILSHARPDYRSDDVRTLRFTVDTAECLAFSIMLGGLAPGRSDGTVSGTAGQVLGFYCSAPGAILGDSDIAEILGGWRTLGASHEILVDGRIYARR
jgi:hypothetical protein